MACLCCGCVSRGQCVAVGFASKFKSMAFTYLWVHDVNICPLLSSAMLGEFTHLTYSSINRGVERGTEKIPTGPLNMFRELRGSLTSAKRPVAEARDHWCSLCLFCRNSVRFPYGYKMFVFPKARSSKDRAHLCSPYTCPKGVVAPSLRREAGVVHVEHQDTAIIPRMFLIAGFENPSRVLFCMAQDYLVVTVGSLAWCGDAMFPGCPRQAGHWNTHQLKCLSVHFGARNGVQLFCSPILVSAVAGLPTSHICASCGFTCSCLVSGHRSDLFAARSGYCPIWGLCAVCYLRART